MRQSEFDLSSEEHDGAVLVRATGRADEGDLPRFQRALEASASADAVVVDLAGLEYLSSWGFGILVSTSETMQQRNCPIVFVRPTGKLNKLFDILQLDRILRIYETPDTALQSLCDGDAGTDAEGGGA